MKKVIQPKLQASQLVNKVGRYLYKNMDGAFQMKSTSNTFDVYTTLLYELLPEFQSPRNSNEENDVQEMTLNLSITTYQNKIRLNIIEVDPNERTLGYFLYPPELFDNMETAFTKIQRDFNRTVTKKYERYEILF